MRLVKPTPGKIQQGAIFNCALVSGYENCQCYGLVLTARCDLEHGKYSIINYLPVVRFSDWSKREMCFHVARRLQKSISGAIKKALLEKKVTEHVLATFPLKDIIGMQTSGEVQKRLLEKLGQLNLIESVLLQGGSLNERAPELFRIDEKQCDTLINELIQGKLGEYYFLDSTDIYESTGEGYVVLLRYVRTLSHETGMKIVTGIEKEEAQQDSSLSSILSFCHEPICMITGVLRSPEIEHLAQTFANLFVRIGLEDYEDETFEHHRSIVRI